MPENISVNHVVEMTPEERKLYDQLKDDLIIPLEDGDIDFIIDICIYSVAT